VFKVSNTKLADLDKLEGHPRWYKREIIPIKLKSGKVVNCWVYFNDKAINKNTTFHKTYTQSYLGYTSNWRNNWLRFDNDTAIDTFREDEILREDEVVETKPFCVGCYNDLKFDGFSNYHCSSCDSWFTESEILQDHFVERSVDRIMEGSMDNEDTI